MFSFYLAAWCGSFTHSRGRCVHIVLESPAVSAITQMVPSTSPLWPTRAALHLGNVDKTKIERSPDRGEDCAGALYTRLQSCGDYVAVSGPIQDIRMPE